MIFHNAPVKIGDRVFDISVNRGYGKVIRVLDDSIEVKFPRYSLSYDGMGVQNGKDWPTLYWDRPLVIAPAKEEFNWAIKRGIVDKFFKIIEDSKGIM